MDNLRRAEVLLTEPLLLGLLGVESVTIVGADYDPRSGNVSLYLTGDKCPQIPEGGMAPVVNLESLR